MFMKKSKDKIDIVYTWVDGSDPKWLAKKNRHLESDQYSNCIPSQVGEQRYSDNLELKYSLLTVSKFAPWVNNIYIVTDQQSPRWLENIPNVVIIDHKDIIPSEYLPTFNSSVIEAHLHNIPGLAEKFIYFNDDMMLGRECQPSDFFKKGLPKVFTSSLLPRMRNKRKVLKTYNMMAIENSRILSKSNTGFIINYGLRHGVRPILKSRMKLTYNIYYDSIHNLFSEKFRLTPFSLLYLYTFTEIANKMAIPKYMSNLKKRTLLNFYPGFCYIKEENLLYFSENISKIKPLVFCINEITTSLENTKLFRDS